MDRGQVTPDWIDKARHQSWWDSARPSLGRKRRMEERGLYVDRGIRILM